MLLSLFLLVFTISLAKPVLYFFESPTCPHCQNMKAYLNYLKSQYDFDVKMYSVSDKEALILVNEMACAYNYTLVGVPTFFINDKVFAGDGQGSKVGILNEIKYCSNHTCLDPMDVVKANEYRCSFSKDSPVDDSNGGIGVFLFFGLVIALVIVGYFITKHK